MREKEKRTGRGEKEVVVKVGDNKRLSLVRVLTSVAYKGKSGIACTSMRCLILIGYINLVSQSGLWIAEFKYFDK